MATSHQAKVRECKLPGCLKCQNRIERNHNSDDGICFNNRSMFDGLPLRCVGDWANEKIHYLSRYFEIFAGGMKDLWDGNLRYIEVCSGPGRCSTRNGYEQDGTALAILNNEAVRHITDAIFIDYNQTAVDTLNTRIRNVGLETKARARIANYNDPDAIRRVLRERPFSGLAFCLIDPTSCDIPFETVKTIARAAGSKCDLLISFFSNTDFRRNAVNATLDPAFYAARERYTRFLGQPDFFTQSEVIEAAKLENFVKLATLFQIAYGNSLQALGYHCAAPVRVADYYHLLFASRHPRGLQFWKSAVKLAYNGQGELF